MNNSFEGDLIRPLGLVTLYFAYAEYELDQLLEDLSPLQPYLDQERTWPAGSKLTRAQGLLRQLGGSSELSELQQALKETRSLFKRRNALVHSGIFAGGRLVSGRPGVPESRISVQELEDLSQAIFTCKERISVGRQRIVRPLLTTQL